MHAALPERTPAGGHVLQEHDSSAGPHDLASSLARLEQLEGSELRSRRPQQMQGAAQRQMEPASGGGLSEAQRKAAGSRDELHVDLDQGELSAGMHVGSGEAVPLSSARHAAGEGGSSEHY